MLHPKVLQILVLRNAFSTILRRKNKKPILQKSTTIRPMYFWKILITGLLISIVVMLMLCCFFFAIKKDGIRLAVDHDIFSGN